MPVVDASVFVACFNPGDAAHSRCAGWLRNAIAARESLVAPSLLLVEVAGAIRRIGGNPETGRRAIAEILGLPGLDIVDLDGARARRAAEVAADAGLRGADAVYLALAAERGDKLISLDRQQRERGRSVADVREP